ncbi:hypothetical protein [Clostridium gasigenes]|nr:hypothetical protein [Clostridium gasigenes]
MRKLNVITELGDKKGAEPMKNLLIDIKKEVDLTWNDANVVTLGSVK